MYYVPTKSSGPFYHNASLLSAVIVSTTGAGMGFVFGMFLGAMGDMQPLQMVNGRQVPQAPLGEQVQSMMR